VKVLFVAGFGPVYRDQAATTALYRDTLGLPFEEDDGYFHTDKLPGVKAFALWPLAQAAQSCFGTDTWPDDVPVPQAWLEFDVDDLETATAELKARGYRLLVTARKEPWGQTVTRLLGPEGLLIGVTVTPWMRDEVTKGS
jgi:catechol 2,3-dioxygenase-like lactoylglutathione lyase family enzyme